MGGRGWGTDGKGKGFYALGGNFHILECSPSFLPFLPGREPVAQHGKSWTSQAPDTTVSLLWIPPPSALRPVRPWVSPAAFLLQGRQQWKGQVLSPRKAKLITESWMQPFLWQWRNFGLERGGVWFRSSTQQFSWAGHPPHPAFSGLMLPLRAV